MGSLSQGKQPGTGTFTIWCVCPEIWVFLGHIWGIPGLAEPCSGCAEQESCLRTPCRVPATPHMLGMAAVIRIYLSCLLPGVCDRHC